MKVHFEKHEGTLDRGSNMVTFYGLEFESICHAIPFLRLVDPGGQYNQWYYRGFKGIQDENNMVFVCEKWFTDDDEAEYYINKQYGKLHRIKKSPSFFETD